METFEERAAKRDNLLRGISRRLANQTLRKLAELDPIITAMINRRGPIGDDRLSEIRDQLRIVTRDLMSQVNDDLTTGLIELGAQSYDFAEEELITRARRINVGSASPKAPNRDQLLAIVRSRPFRGRFLRQWTAQARSNIVKSVERQIQVGILAGEPKSKIVERLEGVRGRRGAYVTSRSAMKAIVQTAVTHVNNQAAELAMEARRDIVESVIYISIPDGRRTEVCENLHLTEWPINEGPRPPQHFNCRSRTRPKFRPRN